MAAWADVIGGGPTQGCPCPGSSHKLPWPLHFSNLSHSECQSKKLRHRCSCRSLPLVSAGSCAVEEPLSVDWCVWEIELTMDLQPRDQLTPCPHQAAPVAAVAPGAPCQSASPPLLLLLAQLPDRCRTFLLGCYPVPAAAAEQRAPWQQAQHGMPGMDSVLSCTRPVKAMLPVPFGCWASSCAAAVAGSLSLR